MNYSLFQIFKYPSALRAHKFDFTSNQTIKMTKTKRPKIVVFLYACHTGRIIIEHCLFDIIHQIYSALHIIEVQASILRMNRSNGFVFEFVSDSNSK